MPAERRTRVLFLCTGNSCRSQMAEGWARALCKEEFDVESAGTHPHGLNPLAVKAMTQAGVDISTHTSKRVQDVPGPFDVVVTVCDSAHESCPALPGARTIHAPFDDPPRLAAHARNTEEAMSHYARVRDEIRAFVETLPSLLLTSHTKVKGLGMNPTTPSSCCGVPDCCKAESSSPPASLSQPGVGSAPDHVREAVRSGYAEIALAGSWAATKPTTAPSDTGCCATAPSRSGGGCCGPVTFSPEQLATAIGYASTDLAHAPDSANLGLSCGNPTALASLKPGEVVLDLGSGGGFDAFIAGAKVGPTGRVMGVDMTPDMIVLARRNTAAYTVRTGLTNVEFRLGEIEHLPVADASVDVVISNCVLNLSPEKQQVWKELARVLRPGGRVAVSDLALLRPLPEAIRRDIEALVGCVAGAALVDDIRSTALAAGLVDVVTTPKPGYVAAMSNSADPLYQRILNHLPAGTTPADYITSLDISARRP